MKTVKEHKKGLDNIRWQRKGDKQEEGNKKR